MHNIATIEKNILALFPGFDGSIKIKTGNRGKDKGIFITVTQMYDRPTIPGGILKFYKSMAEAIGVDDLEELDDIRSSGCETCDYGSEYGFELWAKGIPE